MEQVNINYLAILTGGIISMIVGFIWYGPIFGKKWMKINSMTEISKEKIKEMQKKAIPLYFIQLILTLFQVLILAHLIADTKTVGGLTRSVFIWAGFIIPTLAGASMWTNDSGKNKWSKFLIQSGYQLVIFIIFGWLLEFWK